MANRKGPNLEELVRAFFHQQGFYCLRGVSFRFEGQDVTDIDVWLYGKQGASVRTRAIVDVKNKKSPKALERILWVKGMQSALRCDRAMVATTDNDPRVARFARQQGVALLTKSFIARLEKGIDGSNRLSEEDFIQNVKTYPAAKQDGDWVKVLESIQSSVISAPGFSAFNQAMAAFRIFSQKVKTRPLHVEQALRCTYLAASVACVALDSGLSSAVYDDVDSRYRVIMNGVTYGDDGDGRVQASMGTVLDVIASRMENGRSIAAQAKGALDAAFASVRAEIIAEFFSRDQSGVNLFRIARILEERSHAGDPKGLLDLSVEEKMVLGIFSDFVQTPRSNLFSASLLMQTKVVGVADGSEGDAPNSDGNEDGSMQSKLL